MWSVRPGKELGCLLRGKSNTGQSLRVVLLYKSPWLSLPRQTLGSAHISHHQQLQHKLRASPALTQAGFLISDVCCSQGFHCLIPTVQPWKWSFPGRYLPSLPQSEQVPAQREAVTSLATPVLEVGMDPMLHVLTVKAGSCVGCTAECVSAESLSFLGYLLENV